MLASGLLVEEVDSIAAVERGLGFTMYGSGF